MDPFFAPCAVLVNRAPRRNDAAWIVSYSVFFAIDITILVLFSLLHIMESILITVTKGPYLQPFKILYVPKISEAAVE